jgi:hypothetical protein
MDTMAMIGSGSPGDPDANITDLLQNLNLTAEEEDVVEFSDNEDAKAPTGVEWALFVKVSVAGGSPPQYNLPGHETSLGKSLWSEGEINWREGGQSLCYGVQPATRHGAGAWRITVVGWAARSTTVAL